MRTSRRLDALVRKLVPEPFDLDEFVLNASTEIGIPILMLTGVSSGVSLSGVSMRADQCAFISSPASANEEHRIHVVSHEILHLVDDHVCAAVAEDHSYNLIHSLRRQRIERSCERFAWKVGFAVLQQRVGDGGGPTEVPARMLSSAFGFRA